MGCLRITYHQEESPLRVSRDEENACESWEVWTSEKAESGEVEEEVSQSGGDSFFGNIADGFVGLGKVYAGMLPDISQKGGVVPMGSNGVGWPDNHEVDGIQHAEFMDTKLFPSMSPKVVPTNYVEVWKNTHDVIGFGNDIGGGINKGVSLFIRYLETAPGVFTPDSVMLDPRLNWSDTIRGEYKNPSW